MHLRIVKYSDEQLVADLQAPEVQRQDKALKYLYQEYFPVAKKIIAGYQHVLSVKDLFQDAMIVVYKNVRSGKYAGKSTLKTYLMGIVKNLCKKQIQDEVQASQRLQDWANNRTEIHSEIEKVSEEEQDRRMAVVMACLDRLDEKCWTLLSGYYFEGLRMAQLSAQLGYVSAQVTKSKKYKCMKKLMEMVKEKLKSSGFKVYKKQ
ncbi:MAG: sigma-70 family RNA polymerase sigma factor [Flavobacteriaceae bacterium]|nr:sigma-70 family RNA polymerase sigma factor [Flavobacteriaceae bacterium]